jgi:kynureninase
VSDDRAAALAALAGRAAALDAADPLAGTRDRFTLPDGVTYLDGNSLGAMLATVPGRVDDVVRHEWGERLIGSWTSSGWWDAPQRVGDRIAPLIGAAPGQVVVADSTSVSLFRVLVAALRANAPRDELLVDAASFPTDAYLAESVGRLSGATVRPADLDDLGAALSGRTAAVLANHVDYRTGRLHDLPGLTAQCHRAGALAVWDLSHSVGVLPIGLDAAGVDLAVGATYKFLGGGPGAPAFTYVPLAAQATFDQPLTGWGGHADPFAMAPGYAADPGIARVRTGTPDILSLLALDAALDVWDAVELADVRTKGLALTAFFMDCVDALLPGAGVEIVTPRGPDRGHQVSLRVADAAAGQSRLAEAGVVVDHRPPELLRFGLAPLYTRYVDALHAVRTLAGQLQSEA